MAFLATLHGSKTYLVAAGLAVLAAAKYLEYIDTETAATLTILLTGGGLAALRAGVEKQKR